MLLQLLLALASQPVVGLEWTPSLEKALAQAAAEKKVVFLAVNMDGEPANDRMVEKIYKDKEVVAQAAATLNVVASAAEHAPKGRPCPRFGSVQCADHRNSDIFARGKILKSDSKGFVVAPQHVFLAPDGKVLLSVPYEVDANELVWCFATAASRAFPETKRPLPPGARMPRRVILGGVYDPSKNEQGAAPPTKAEVQELIKDLRRGLPPDEQMARLRRLILSEEPDAIEYVQQELKSNGAGQGGGGLGGGGRGGGGGGAGAGGRVGDGSQRHARILKAIGAFGPRAYAPLVLPFLEHPNEDVRSEAAVALEELGDPETLRELQTAFGKEKDPIVKARLSRALGSAGARDPRIHALLLKQAKSEKNERVVAALTIALGYAEDDAAVDSHLEAQLGAKELVDFETAAAAIALSRHEKWIAKLEAAKPTADEARKKILAQALDALKGGKPAELGGWIANVTGDGLTRERFFGPGR
jgi:uncharacterized membrane protein YgcG